MSRRLDPVLPDDLREAAVEALVFASEEPVHPEEIAKVLGGMELDDVERVITALEKKYEEVGSGLQIERVAGGFRLATRPDLAEWVRSFFQHRNRTRLSPAALETLAIVAYRQPVTSPEIQAIRGKDPSAALKGLLDKKLLRILGKKKVVGSPLLYGTTKRFLIHFGLDSLQELPSMEDFDQLLGVLEGEQASLLENDPAEAEASELEPAPQPADDAAATEGVELTAALADPLQPLQPGAGEGEPKGRNGGDG